MLDAHVFIYLIVICTDTEKRNFQMSKKWSLRKTMAISQQVISRLFIADHYHSLFQLISDFAEKFSKKKKFPKNNQKFISFL